VVGFVIGCACLPVRREVESRRVKIHEVPRVLGARRVPNPHYATHMGAFKTLSDTLENAPYTEFDHAKYGRLRVKDVPVTRDTFYPLIRGLIWALEQVSDEWGGEGVVRADVWFVVKEYACAGLIKNVLLAHDLLSILANGELDDQFVRLSASSLHAFYDEYFDDDSRARVDPALRRIQCVLERATGRAITEGEYIDACADIATLYTSSAW